MGLGGGTQPGALKVRLLPWIDTKGVSGVWKTAAFSIPEELIPQPRGRGLCEDRAPLLAKRQCHDLWIQKGIINDRGIRGWLWHGVRAVAGPLLLGIGFLAETLLLGDSDMPDPGVVEGDV